MANFKSQTTTKLSGRQRAYQRANSLGSSSGGSSLGMPSLGSSYPSGATAFTVAPFTAPRLTQAPTLSPYPVLDTSIFGGINLFAPAASGTGLTPVAPARAGGRDRTRTGLGSLLSGTTNRWSNA